MVENSYSAGGVVLGPQGLIVLTNQDGVVWSLPKGRLEPGEGAKSAAVREIKEETGITQLEFIKELGTYSRYKIGKLGRGEDISVKKTITVFLYTTTESSLNPTDPAHPEARWVPIRDVPKLLSNEKDRGFYLSVLPEVETFAKKSK